jgi:tetratricopeptide (TPR) repeat protein
MAVSEVQSGSARDPYWLLYERGLLEMDRGEYGKALQLFMSARDLRSPYPEVEIAIGDIYRIQGEVTLAMLQYEEAYRARSHLFVPQHRYTALYRLVDIHKATEDDDELERILLRILKDDFTSIGAAVYERGLRRLPAQADIDFLDNLYIREEDGLSYSLRSDLDPEQEFRLNRLLRSFGIESYYLDVFQRLRERLLRTYRERGLDRVLTLYRLENRAAARAHGELAALYLKREPRSPEAVTHYLFAVVIHLSNLVDEIRFWDPVFEFSGLGELMSRVVANPSLRSYISRTDLPKFLYYLGVATFGIGAAGGDWVEVGEERAREIFGLLSDIQDAGRYRNLAAKQLVAPWIKPLLYID